MDFIAYRFEQISHAKQESDVEPTFGRQPPEVPVEVTQVKLRPDRPGQPLKEVKITERFVFKRGALVVYVYYDPGLGLTREEREAMKGVFS